MRAATLIISFCFFISIQGLWAGNVLITGKSPDYAGKTITLYAYENFITRDEKVLATATVNLQGEFSFQFTLPGTELVFTHAGSYFLYLYIEPGKSYEIELPPEEDETPEEELNPYFEESRQQINILSSRNLGQETPVDKNSELNSLISNFDHVFDPIYTNRSYRVYLDAKTFNLDSLVQKLDSLFNGSPNAFYKEYCIYKIGLLKFMSSRFKSRNISDNYFLNKPILYRNPAYMELFNQVYTKYFLYFGRTQTGKIIYNEINLKKSLSGLKATLGQDKVLSNDTLEELVILKGIHDGFYEMDFSRNALLQILDSLAITSKIRTHREMANDIRKKVTKLLPGYTPPDFRLLNQDSVWTSLESFRGSMVYIIFCTTQNYACFKEYDQLKKLQQEHGNILKIVTISIDESLRNIQNFTKKYPYNWTFLYYGNQPGILKDYDIRTIPTYFLVGPDGKLIMSPAPSPSENFETALFNYLKAKHQL